MRGLIKYIINNNLGDIFTNVTFSQLTTLKVGGKIKALYYPNNLNSLLIAYSYIQENNYPIIVIGGGSNILAQDKEFKGVVICLKKMKDDYKFNGNKVIIPAGKMINQVIYDMQKKNLGGLEFLSAIPATIGGLIVMNASAYNKQISDYLVSVIVITNEGRLKEYQKKDLSFGYRCSSFQDKNEIIVRAEFRLPYQEKLETSKVSKKYVIKRYFSQPLFSFNAGSTFKNSDILPTWRLIDDLGLRGYSINDAAVSEIHSNFLINKKQATSEDMHSLIALIKEQVYQKYEIDLVLEWIELSY